LKNGFAVGRSNQKRGFFDWAEAGGERESSLTIFLTFKQTIFKGTDIFQTFSTFPTFILNLG
jgi:hypothetical protein